MLGQDVQHSKKNTGESFPPVFLQVPPPSSSPFPAFPVETLELFPPFMKATLVKFELGFVVTLLKEGTKLSFHHLPQH